MIVRMGSLGALALPLLALELLPAAARNPDELPPVVAIVDDRGAEIATPLDVCVERGTTRACESRAGSATATPLSGVDALRVEGPGHGPASFTRASLIPDAEGRLRLVVPRKGKLRFPRVEPLAIALFPLGAPDAERPLHRLSTRTAEAFVPAGDWLVSILGTAEGEAPDLHVLHVAPGATVSLSRTARRGWSLAIRSTDGENALDDAEVVARPSGEDLAETKPVRARTGVEGFALFTGLPAPDVEVEVSRRGYVPARRPWVWSRPGTFTLRPVPMERAGAVLLHLESATLPVADVLCELLDDEPHRPTRDRVPRRVVRSGRTDDSGTLRFDDVPRGRWPIRIRPAGRAGADHPVDVESGQVTERTVTIDAIPVSGRVTRGREPVPGATVQIRARAARGLPTDEGGFVRAKSDEDGRYEATVLTEGLHDFVLILEEVPVTSRSAFVGKGGVEVDFDLNEHAVRGRVVDDEGRPVEGATVALRLGTFHRLVDSTTDGRFEFPILGRGPARLFASRRGFRDSEPSVVEVGDGPVPETLLTVTRLPSVRGRLLLAAGSPAPGQLVASVDGAGQPLDETRSDAEGRFEVRADPASTWLLTGGASCALAATRATPGEDEVVVRCAPLPSALALALRDESGSPLPREALLLRLNGGPVPTPFLQQHLAASGLPGTTDASGRIDLVALAPALVEVFAARAASAMTVAGGSPSGLLTSRMLAPGERAEEVVTFRPATRVGP